MRNARLESDAQPHYRVILPERRHFDCARLHATISTHACADRWHQTAQGREQEHQDRFVLCRRCPTGARHFEEHRNEIAGGEQRQNSRVPRAPLCIRCGKPAARLIGREICPSCANRFYEYVKGRNARGNLPTAYTPPVPRRVGVIERDGRRGWRTFEGQAFGESFARAVRAGFMLHEHHPGRVVWNAEARRFEYRDAAGRVLQETVIEGALVFVAVERLQAGQRPAPVLAPPQLLTVEEAAVWFEVSRDIELRGDWQQTDVGCRRCGSGVLHARRIKGAVECRCSTGCS